MKTRNIYVVVVALLLSAFCSSCVVDNTDGKDRLTRKGMVMYQYYQFNTFRVIKDYVDLGFKLNAWLALPDSARRDIEMKYFPNTKIFQERTGVYGLYENAKLVYTINTNGYALSDADADWVISWKDDPAANNGEPCAQSFTEGAHELHITHVDDATRNAWQVRLADPDSAHSYIDIVVEPEGGGEYIAESLFEWSFSITGSGCYTFRQNIWEKNKPSEYKTYLQFNIEETMPWMCNYDAIGPSSYIYGTYHFRGGKVALNATNHKGESLPVYAAFKGIYDVAITYKDVTEIYNVEERDYYYE